MSGEITMIDPEATVQAMRNWPEDLWGKLSALPHYIKSWRLVFDENPPAKLADASLAELHVAGVIMLFNLATVFGRTPQLINQNAYLTPKQQSGLADLLDRL